MKTREFPCPAVDCHQSFRTQNKLDEHLESHSIEVRDPKDFSCSICGRVLSTKQSLREHSFVHKDKKTFRCSEVGCGKMFKQNSQLCNHRKLHKIARMKSRKSENKGKPEEAQIKYFKLQGTVLSEKCSLVDVKEVVLPSITGPTFGVTLPRFNSMF